MKRYLTFILALISFSSLADEPLFSVRRTYDKYFPDRYKIIELTSKVNNLIVKNLTINNGECKSLTRAFFVMYGNYPIQMKNGDSIKLRTPVDCNIQELTTETNFGKVEKIWK